MEIKEIKIFLGETDLVEETEYQIVTIEEIKNNLNHLNINSIKINDVEVDLDFGTIRYKYLNNDYNNPLVIKKDDIEDITTLTVNPKWYQDNKQTCNKLFEFICENAKDEFLSMNNFDSSIGWDRERKIILDYDYRKLSTSNHIDINQKLSEVELTNLKYLPEKIKLFFKSDEYNELKQIILKLKELDKTNPIIIDVTDKELFNNWILTNGLEYSNIYVKLGTNEYPLQEYLGLEKKLYELTSGIEDLSPFEKYIYIYNVTKKYKEYKEKEEDRIASRNLYDILTNEYMVCAGFSNMLGDLLNKNNIENVELHTEVDSSYDGVKKSQEIFTDVKPVEKNMHARRYVHIIDEKYGINGFYIADPTWDNDLEKDYYNYLVMTGEEASQTREYIWNNTENSMELLNINSIEEYYQKINFLISRENKNTNIKEIMKNLINDIIAKLDKNYISELKKKYNYIDSWNWPEEINDLIYDVGEYLLKHVNKKISGETIIEAVGNVYKKAYGYNDEECQVKMQEIIDQNKRAQMFLFPTRYKINQDGSKEIIMNETNKFDIELETKTK